MPYQNLVLFSGFLLFYSLFAGRFEKRLVNGPLMFMLVGLLLGPAVSGLLQVEVNGKTMRLLAEITLALVLFTDAAKADLRVLRSYNWIPVRLLLIGLPLCLLAGWLFGMWLFEGMPWLEAAILATMLAPTDAALGKAVTSNASVPAPIREGLNVESGLNDGICVPVLLLLLGLIAPEEQHKGTLGMAMHLFLEEIGIGGVVGIAVATGTAFCLKHTEKLGWSIPMWRPLIMTGLFTGHFLQPQRKEKLLESNESFGELLSICVWVLFGATAVATALVQFPWQAWLYALASLTVLRMLPVWLCLAGTDLPFQTRLFMGWFGPRGLASIVFVLMVIQYPLQQTGPITATVIATVVLSVVAHGMSANPWVARIRK
jgi:NhaP-type Na+/H+ or K+/H+ antiporter